MPNQLPQSSRPRSGLLFLGMVGAFVFLLGTTAIAVGAGWLSRATSSVAAVPSTASVGAGTDLSQQQIEAQAIKFAQREFGVKSDSPPVQAKKMSKVEYYARFWPNVGHPPEDAMSLHEPVWLAVVREDPTTPIYMLIDTKGHLILISNNRNAPTTALDLNIVPSAAAINDVEQRLLAERQTPVPAPTFLRGDNPPPVPAGSTPLPPK